MGRKLNPKKKTTISRKLLEEIQSPGVSGFGTDYIHTNHDCVFYKNPCAEIPNLPPAAEPTRTFGLVSKSIDEILKEARNEDSSGRCNSIWKDGDW
jgi:hypothetical protein